MYVSVDFKCLTLLHVFMFSLCCSCVGVDEDDAPDIDIYHCPNCEKTHGKSTCEYFQTSTASVNRAWNCVWVLKFPRVTVLERFLRWITSERRSIRRGKASGDETRVLLIIYVNAVIPQKHGNCDL